jgi:RND family efflux transporter MFP subunit
MHSRQIFAAALLPFSISLTGCLGDARAAERPKTESAKAIVVRPATLVNTEATVAASGVIDARASADIAFQVPGKVVGIGAEEGQYVSAGQFLAQLDRTDYRLSYEQAELAHTRSADEARRAKVLREVNGIAPNDFEKIDNAEHQAAVSGAIAQKRLNDTRLTAPLSGIIARRDIEMGETVAAGRPVFTIVDLDVVHVRVSVPEADVGSISAGNTATITVPSLGSETFTGRVRLVGVAADASSRTYAVEVAISNPSHRLKAGMIAEASIETGKVAPQLTIPAAAIVRDVEGASRVFVYNEADQRVHARRVTVSGIAGTDVAITDGITSGELIVVAGQRQLREGMSAKPTNEAIVITGSAPAPHTSSANPVVRGASRGGAL